MAVLAFDIYGTLIDPHGMESHLERVFGPNARLATELWRDKQVEYSFRRALMGRYEDFDVCTAQALVYVGRRLRTSLTERDQIVLRDHYRCLPSFPDVASGLEAVSARGHLLVAFSNGSAAAVRGLLKHAGLLLSFRDIISVDEVKNFKPSPTVYEHLERRVGEARESIWLVSSNPFDVIGAKSYGLRTVWLQRDVSGVFDPWEYTPDLVVHSLADLVDAIDNHNC